MTAPRSRVSATTLAGLVVCLVACAAYAATIPAYFLNDDFGVVALLAAKPSTYFPRWFVTSWMDAIWGFNPDEIRPFPAVSYQLTSLAGAGSPIAHHLLNVAIHAANGVLVLALARTAIGLSVWSAAVAALVFVLLPVQTESVAWITGRVDSLPALFYLGSVVAWVRWRQTAQALHAPPAPPAPQAPWALYSVSLTLGFMALFSKQNTITLVPALLLYDILIERRWPRPSWSWLWPYLPFIAITLGYLYLRLALFGEVVRESLVTVDWMAYAFGMIERHAWRVIFGHATPPSALERWTLIAILLIIAFCAIRAAQRGRVRAAASVMSFVVLWWVLGVAPVLVAGYESPRHVYLASVAWAMFVGLAFEWMWAVSRRRAVRAIVILVTAAILGTYTAHLSASLADWNARALVSRHAAQDVEREALAAPEGTLLIVGAPASVWEWALPFVVRPPFARSDLTSRVHIVSPRLLHCCRGQWEVDTRQTIERWRSRSDAPSVVALRWNEQTGAVLRATDREVPDLRSLASYLAEIPSGDDMDRIMTDALQRLLVR